MGHRPDRRQGVLLEVVVPAVVQERGELEAAVVGQDPPSQRQPRGGAGDHPPEAQGPALGGRERPVGEPALHGRAGESPRLAVQRPERHRRAEREPHQERPPDVQVVDQPEQVVNEVVVRDRRQAGTVARILAGIVEEDGPEVLRQPVEQERVDPIRRGDPRDQEHRRTLPEDAVGHPVSRAVTVSDLGRRVVTQHLGAEIGGGRAGGARGRLGTGRGRGAAPRGQ